MKKVIWIFVGILLIISAYAVAGPFLTLNAIKSGIQEKDLEKLSENIDFPLLRQNLKEQINAEMMASLAAESGNDPYGALTAGLASQMVDGMVDSFVTPAGLERLVTGEGQPGQAQPASTASAAPTNSNWNSDAFSNARYSFDSTRKFSIFLPEEGGEDELRILLTRSGLKWRLTNIVVPPFAAQ